MKLYIVTEGRAGSTLLYQHLTQMGIPVERKISWGKLKKEGITAKSLSPANFIHLKRMNKVQQAVSRIKHLYHNQQHVRSDDTMSKYRERDGAIADIPFPRDEINDRIISNATGDKAWDLFFEQVPSNNVIVVQFEHLIKKRDDILSQICEKFKLDLELDALKESLKSTHTSLNDKWTQRTIAGYTKYL